MTDIYKVSDSAWRRGGSSMFLEPGQTITVEDLLRGAIIVSGNDASITLAEGSSGSQEHFVKEMNITAKKLGLQNSYFVNVTGWPDEGHVMSANDLLKLGIKIYEDFPEYYHLFAEKEFTYNKVFQHNTNELLWSKLAVDGVKTGSTQAGGFGLVLSAQQNGRRIFAVMNGLQSKRERRKGGERLVQYAFNNFDNKTLFKSGDSIEQIEVWFGKEKFIPLVIHEDMVITYPRGEEKNIKASVIYQNTVQAPIYQKQKLGTLEIAVPGQKVRQIALYAGRDVPKLSFMQKLIRKIEIIFGLS